MMKDTTGTAFTAATSGARSSPTARNRAERAASDAASTQESTKPPRMAAADRPTAAQKAPVPASDASRTRALTGEASSRFPWG